MKGAHVYSSVKGQNQVVSDQIKFYGFYWLEFSLLTGYARIHKHCLRDELWFAYHKDYIAQDEVANVIQYITWLGTVLALAGKEASRLYQLEARKVREETGRFLNPFVFLAE